MNDPRKSRLEAAGFTVGTADGFLGLTEEESAWVSLRMALAELVRRQRLGRKFSQTELARRLGSSQSRVAKLEAAKSDVSLDLLFRALFVTGAEADGVTGTLTKAIRFLRAENADHRTSGVSSTRSSPKRALAR